MGHAYAYRCNVCGYEELFNQGHGFSIHSQRVEEYLLLNKKLFHYKTHNKILQLANDFKDLWIKAGFQVYMCPKCKILFDKAEIEVYNDDKIMHKSRFRCSNCRSRLKLTNIHRLYKAACPVCKKNTFKRDKEHHDIWN